MTPYQLHLLHLKLFQLRQSLVEEQVRIKGQVIADKPAHILSPKQSIQVEQKLDVPVLLKRIHLHQHVPLELVELLTVNREKWIGQHLVLEEETLL